VLDVADLHRDELTIPAAFRAVPPRVAQSMTILINMDGHRLLTLPPLASALARCARRVFSARFGPCRMTGQGCAFWPKTRVEVKRPSAALATTILAAGSSLPGRTRDAPLSLGRDTTLCGDRRARAGGPDRIRTCGLCPRRAAAWPDRCLRERKPRECRAILRTWKSRRFARTSWWS
jgi:hypothetical protein